MYNNSWVLESRCLNRTPAFKQSVRRVVCFLCASCLDFPAC